MEDLKESTIKLLEELGLPKAFAEALNYDNPERIESALEALSKTLDKKKDDNADALRKAAGVNMRGSK